MMAEASRTFGAGVEPVKVTAGKMHCFEMLKICFLQQWLADKHK